MRYLAVARYRLLTTIRSASWIFAISLAAVLIPMASDGWTKPELYYGENNGLGSGTLFVRQTKVLSDPVYMLSSSATITLVSYVLHGIILLVACSVFATSRQRTDGHEASDLMDTAPLTPAVRFWGDTLGILASALLVHLCTLPLLALIIARSPFRNTTFLYYELALLAAVILASAGGAWKMRAGHSGWSQTRSVRSAATFVILLWVAVAINTRWEAFRDAFAAFASFPSAGSWYELMDTVNSPSLLVLSLLLLYAGFISFYFLQTVRSLETR
jgi:hypothetical protein